MASIFGQRRSKSGYLGCREGIRANPFEAQLETRDGTLWTIREIEDVDLQRVRALLEDGLSVRDIEAETGIPKSTVGRLKKKIEAEAAGKKQLDAAA
jgi:DNA invertase Pin-like site-specific DNA recombinase